MPKRRTGAKTKKKSTRSKRVAAVKNSSRQKAANSKRVRFKKADLDKFRKAMYEEFQRLAGVVVSIEEQALSKSRSESAGDVSIMPLHPADVSGDNYEQDLALGLMETNRDKLQLIREAVRRMDEGNFGRCVGCDGPIPKARLKAAPWAKYCLACQTELEQNGGI